jgi:hypothetical protein
MKVFRSCSSDDKDIAELLSLALMTGGHEVFFDRETLPVGGDYNKRY